MSTATKTKAANGGKATSKPQAEKAEAAAARPEEAAAKKENRANAFAFTEIPALKGVPSYEEVLQFNRETLDAMLQASTAVAKSYQDLGRAWLGLTQESVEDAVSAGKALAEARSLPEMLEVQSRLAQASLQKAMNESGRLQEMSMRLAEAALQPLNSHFTAAVERWSKPAA